MIAEAKHFGVDDLILIQKATESAEPIFYFSKFERLLEHYEKSYLLCKLENLCCDYKISVERNTKFTILDNYFCDLYKHIRYNYIEKDNILIYNADYEIIFYLITKEYFDYNLVFDWYKDGIISRLSLIELTQKYIECVKESKYIREYLINIFTKLKLIEHINFIL